MPPKLSTHQVSMLRGRAHGLAPSITVGKAGATDGVRAEIDRALASEELIKVALTRTTKVDLPALAHALDAALVQHLGRKVVLYRPADPPRIALA